MGLFSMALSFFLLMDAVGNIPVFISVLKELDTKKQRKIIFRELIFALIIIIAFFFLGDWLLGVLGISQPAVLISGGIILFVIGIKLIFPPEKIPVPPQEASEPFLVPLAMPLIAGPAVLASVMLYAHKGVDPILCIGAILIAWFFSTIILLSAPNLQKILGQKGIAAVERLMGLILIMLSVQMFLEGIKSFLPYG